MEMRFLVHEDGVALVQYDGEDKVIRVPEIYHGVPVTTIDDDCFSGHAELEKVILSEGIEHIGKRAFCGCSSLTEIVTEDNDCTVSGFPKSLLLIGQEAFRCTALHGVHFRSSILQIKERTFADCSNLRQVIFESASRVSLGEEAFCCNKVLEAVTAKNIDRAVIKAECFLGCANLTRVEMPSAAVTLESDVFVGCEKLPSNYFPNINDKYRLSEYDYLNPDYECDVHPDHEADRRYEAMMYRLHATLDSVFIPRFYFELVLPNRSISAKLQGSFGIRNVNEIYFASNAGTLKVNRDARGIALFPLFVFLSKSDKEFVVSVMDIGNMAVCCSMEAADGSFSSSFLGRAMNYALRAIPDHNYYEEPRYSLTGSEVALFYQIFKQLLPRWVRESFRENLDRIGNPSDSEDKRRALMAQHYLMGIAWDSPLPALPDNYDSAQIFNRHCLGLSRARERLLELVALMRQSRRTLTHGILLVGENPAKPELAQGFSEVLGLPTIAISGDEILAENSHNPCSLIAELYKAQTSTALLVLDDLSNPKSILKAMKTSVYDSFLRIKVPLDHMVIIVMADSDADIPKEVLRKFHVIHVDDYTFEEKLSMWESIFTDTMARAGIGKGMYSLEAGFEEAVVREYCCGPDGKDLEQCAEQLLASLVQNCRANHEFYLSDLYELLGPVPGSDCSDHVKFK